MPGGLPWRWILACSVALIDMEEDSPTVSGAGNLSANQKIFGSVGEMYAMTPWHMEFNLYSKAPK